nr:MAG TPA: hypothetical protein [Caudoviricetes sp.]
MFASMLKSPFFFIIIPFYLKKVNMYVIIKGERVCFFG